MGYVCLASFFCFQGKSALNLAVLTEFLFRPKTNSKIFLLPFPRAQLTPLLMRNINYIILRSPLSKMTDLNIFFSILELCKDSLIKSTIVERFRRVVFQFDPTNSISANTGNYSKHYIVQQQGTDLVVTINANQYGDTLYNFAEKVEIVLDVRTEQDKRDTRKALDQIQDDLRAKVGFGLHLNVDFNFATHPEFLAKSLDERTKIVKQVCNVHLPRLITSSDGIVGLVGDDIMKRTIQGRISHVVVQLDPSNSVKSSIGGNYAKHYEIALHCKPCFI
jgi:hypothetical protein